jgi:heparan-alpha-glucosaminide N-acetyltransferase
MNNRIASIDIFRGLTILAMVFVNDLASVTGIPPWMKHAAEGTDSMTFVDMVFPAFLFIVGMSIPFAFSKRRARGDTRGHLWIHLLVRAGGLVLLGILMVNIHDLNPHATGMSRNTWTVLMFICAILIWNQYPSATGIRNSMFLFLRIAGLAGLCVLAGVYRSGDLVTSGWMHTRWWGILGLIGWTYLACGSVYLLSRGSLAAITGSLPLWTALYIGDQTGALSFLGPLRDVLWLGGHVGGHASIATAGMIVALFLRPTPPAISLRQPILWIVTLGLFLGIGGFLLRPLYGISKNMATPAWSLYSAAICCFLYGGLYWLVDIKKIRAPFLFVAPAGSNPLLAYILPDIFYGLLGILGITFWSGELGAGVPGILRAALFAFVIVRLTGVFTRWGVQLRM